MPARMHAAVISSNRLRFPPWHASIKNTFLCYSSYDVSNSRKPGCRTLSCPPLGGLEPLGGLLNAALPAC
eukprot:10582553-Heterocapsa_arctica.AAC.1